MAPTKAIRKARKRKRKQNFIGCPKCGNSLMRISGFIVCRKCGHRLGSQNPHQLTSEFGQVIRPSQATLLGQSPVSPVDDEEPIGKLPKGRRLPLEFKD